MGIMKDVEAITLPLILDFISLAMDVGEMHKAIIVSSDGLMMSSTYRDID
jgi:predicted regulator of Ras-like GTPase activity (Roadblock/LC7/MglB family)